MALIQGWLVWLWVAALVVGAAAYLVVRSRRGSDGVPLANTSALRKLPRYRVLLRRYRLLSGLLAGGLALVALSSIVLSARPASSQSVPGQQSNRDIMLCLDVSDSMAALDAALLERFDAIAGKLHGQRLGLTIFDAGAVLKFPLTDDYAFVHDQLALGARSVGNPGGVNWLVGTIPAGSGGSSLIGDGIASCLQGFDHPKQKRARSIVLATDGEPGDGSIYSVPAGGRLAAGKGVHVYVLSRVTPQHQDSSFSAQGYADLQTVARTTKGALYAADDPAAVPGIVSKVLALQAKTLRLPPRHVRDDRPTPYVLIAVLGTVGVIVAGWRLGR